MKLKQLLLNHFITYSVLLFVFSSGDVWAYESQASLSSSSNSQPLQPTLNFVGEAKHIETEKFNPFEPKERVHDGLQTQYGDCEEATDDCVEIGRWNLGLSAGLGIRTNPLVDGSNIPLLILPSFSYYGDRFFINNLDLGYTLFEDQDWTINAIASPSYDRVYFSRWDIGNFFINVSDGSFSALPPTGTGQGQTDGDQLAEVSSYELEKRKVSLMGGFELSRHFDQNMVQLDVLKDITNVHQGKEIRFALSVPFSNKDWSSTFGFTWKDEAMTDYYYGVNEEEVVDDRVSYQAESSFNPFVRVNWLQEIDEGSFWRFNLEVQMLDSSITESPIVNESSVVSIFIGKQYKF